MELADTLPNLLRPMSVASIKALLLGAVFLTSSAASAEKWRHYSNFRLDYHIVIPPEFTVELPEPANGDGRTFQTENGRATLAVWGGYIVVRDDFIGVVDWAIENDRSSHWMIAYLRQAPSWASWSGARGDRIFYERAIPICDNATAHFRLIYDRGEKKIFDPLVARLVNSLHSDDCSGR